LAGVANRTATIPITPEGPFFPEVPFQSGLISLPKYMSGFLFQTPQSGQWGEVGFAFDQTMEMIASHFHLFNDKVRRDADLIEEPFDHLS
jgi:hypothetical protein